MSKRFRSGITGQDVLIYWIIAAGVIWALKHFFS